MKSEHYPGINNRFVICDVCGGKFRIYQTVMISGDRYNTQNNLIVCKADVDKINPQIYPVFLKEELLADPQYVRPEVPLLQSPYLFNPASNILPTAPQNLRLVGDPLQPHPRLLWDGPDDVGSSNITGYIIYRAQPQLSIEDIIAEDQVDSAYTDVSANVNEFYTYQVAAYSILGVGPKSNIAYWPKLEIDPTLVFIATDDGFVINTDSGDNLVL